MNKILVFYFFACAVMFLCLTAIFTIMDASQYIIPSEGDITAKKSVESHVSEPPPYTIEEFRLHYRPSETRFRFPVPKLLNGFMYSVSAPVLLYDQLDFEAAYTETLPAAGVFRLEQSLMQDRSWVYRVIVSNGRRNYQMYVRDDTLPATDFYGRLPGPKKMAQYQEQQDSRERYERGKEEDETELQKAYELAIASYYAAEAKRNPKNPILESLKTVQASLAEVDSNGILFSAMAAGFLTLGIAFLLGSVTWLRNTRAWEGDISFDDVSGGERGSDYYEDDVQDEDDEVASDPDDPFS